MRIGHGFDLHRTEEGGPLVLGGVSVPATISLIGHSDADVLLHAVTDAVLGALALGDIGQWFPDTDPQYRGAASSTFLAEVLRADAARGWGLVNLDVTLLAERPRLAPYIPDMRQCLADIFAVTMPCISVKATTMEGTGVIGCGEAIAAHAVILLQPTVAAPGSSQQFDETGAGVNSH